MGYFTFNGTKKNYLVMLQGSQRPVWAPIERELVEISSRNGSVLANSRTQARELTVPVLFKYDSRKDLRSIEEELASWLITDEPAPLVFWDEPDRVYYAVVSNTLNIEDLIRLGYGEITFICPDPYKYSNKTKLLEFDVTDSKDIGVVNYGGTTTHPYFKFRFSEDTPIFNIVSSNSHLMFGAIQDETTDVIKDITPVSFFDDCSSLTGWTNARSVDGGLITSEFTSNGYSFSVQTWGGSGAELNPNGWYGASRIKALPKSIQDFRARTRIGFYGSNANQMGRVELYLLDEVGNHIGKVALKDTSVAGQYPRAEARAGNIGTGTMFVNTYGNRAGVWKDWHNGVIEIQRVGNKWRAYFAIVDEKTGVHHTRLAKEWVDTNKKYMSKLASVQIHIGAYKTYYGISKMHIADVWVNEIVQSQGAQETPIIFKTGDILEIDNRKGKILLNGEPHYETLDPTSNFIEFKRGTNYLNISPPVVQGCEMTFVERWL